MLCGQLSWEWTVGDGGGEVGIPVGEVGIPLGEIGIPLVMAWNGMNYWLPLDGQNDGDALGIAVGQQQRNREIVQDQEIHRDWERTP